MNRIPVLEVDEEIEKATNSLAESMGEDINLIEVKPPSQSDGMDVAGNLLESFHFLKIDRRYIRSDKNKSPTCGMELWYENNQVKFVFYTPTESLMKEYRQQINGYYDGCDISRITDVEGKFVESDSKKEEAVAVTEFQLDKHYFRPPASPNSDESELDTDPFKRIINEIDTKDNTRVIFQVLYKPVSYDWNDLIHTNIETKAKEISKKGSFKTRWFGFKIDEVDGSGKWESTAAEMKSRINEPAFFVNLRMAVICSSETHEQAKTKANSRAKSISNAIKNLYQTKTQQRIVPRKYRINEEKKAKETLVNMIERDATNMYQEKKIHQIIWSKITSNTSTIILTADELAGFVHLPKPEEVTNGSVPWTEKMVDGDVPAEASDEIDIDRDEIKNQKEKEEDMENLEISVDEKEEDDDDDSTDSSPSAIFDR